MKSRLQLGLACTTVGLLLVAAVPQRRPEFATMEARVPRILTQRVKRSERLGTWKVADEAQIAEQEARALTLTLDRDPFADLLAPAVEAEPELTRVLPTRQGDPVDPEPADPIPIVREPVELSEPEFPEPPVLTGISILHQKRHALLGRRIARVGDVFPGGYTVHAIHHDSVVLLNGEEETVLRLGDQR